MKKIAILTIAALCAPIAMNQSYAAPYASQTAPGDDLAESVIDYMDEYVTILEGIYNQSTADAAAPKLRITTAKLDAVTTQIEKAYRSGNASVSPATEARLNQKMNTIMLRAERVIDKLVDKECYGSMPLIEALLETGLQLQEVGARLERLGI